MISYAITACTEHIELDTLLTLLFTHLKSDDEIVVLLDKQKTTTDVYVILDKYKFHDQLKVESIEFNNDFSAHKNYLNSLATQPWIFNIDADELPSIDLLNNIHSILENNDEIEAFLVPRRNIVTGITDEHIKMWRWNVDMGGRINWPDFQMRIYKNNDTIKWSGNVHETLYGSVKTYANFSDDGDTIYYIDHIKDIGKQEKQNQLYQSISSGVV